MIEATANKNIRIGESSQIRIVAPAYGEVRLVSGVNCRAKKGLSDEVGGISASKVFGVNIHQCSN